MRRLLPLLLFVALSACSAESRLAGQAADYYSFLAGHNQSTKYSSFLSPAYRKTLGRDGIKIYDSAVKVGVKEGVRYPVAKAKDVHTKIEGRFALTVANPALGDVYRNQSPIRWVRVGQRWCLYLASDTEKKAYGAFPVGMKAPDFKAEDPK